MIDTETPYKDRSVCSFPVDDARLPSLAGITVPWLKLHGAPS